MAKKPKITLSQFLGIITISERDKWVVRKIYANNTDEKSVSEWSKDLGVNCKGITFKN